MYCLGFIVDTASKQRKTSEWMREVLEVFDLELEDLAKRLDLEVAALARRTVAEAGAQS